MKLFKTIQAFDEVLKDQYISQGLKKELEKHRTALANFESKQLFSKQYQKTVISYENIRRFLISTKSNFEVNYEFQGCKIIFSILVTMKKPHQK